MVISVKKPLARATKLKTFLPCDASTCSNVCLCMSYISVKDMQFNQRVVLSAQIVSFEYFVEPLEVKNDLITHKIRQSIKVIENNILDVLSYLLYC